MLAWIPYHGICPYIFHIWGPFAVRWYGLMYLVGFSIGIWLLRKLSRHRFFPLNPQQAVDFLGWLVLGLILGARFGYWLFYSPHMISNPASLFKIWEGGLSFHGGFIGVTVATILYWRRHRVAFWRLGDGMAMAAPPGIFCVRMANFINGELWGEKTTKEFLFAMKFPRDPDALAALKNLTPKDYSLFQNLLTDLQQSGLDPRFQNPKELFTHFQGLNPYHQDRVIQEVLKINNGSVWEKVGEFVPFRHPSQIYEALGEGLLLGAILWAVYLFCRHKKIQPPPGLFVVIFVGGYGLLRFFIEFVRQPDSHLGRAWGLFSRGHQLCFAMIIAAFLLLFWILKRRRA